MKIDASCNSNFVDMQKVGQNSILEHMGMEQTAVTRRG